MTVHGLVNITYLSCCGFFPKPVILKCIGPGLSADLEDRGDIILIPALCKMDGHSGGQNITCKKIGLLFVTGTFSGMSQHNMSQFVHNGEPNPERRFALIIGYDPIGSVTESVFRIIPAVLVKPFIDIPYILISENTVSIVP